MSKVYCLDWFVLIIIEVDVIVTCVPYVGSHCVWQNVEHESIDREWVSVVVQYYAVPISQPVVVFFSMLKSKRQK